VVDAPLLRCLLWRVLVAQLDAGSPEHVGSWEWQGVLHPRATNCPEVLFLKPDQRRRCLDHADPLPSAVVEPKFIRISKVSNARLIKCALGTEPVGRR